jgi:hypothetical protein
MTNHHCARGCIEAVTRQGEDLLENGFYAQTRADERPCPNFTLDQLQSIRDVTDSVDAAIVAGATRERFDPAMEATKVADLRAKVITDIQDRCTAGGQGLFCQVVTMYRGGQYKLYTFRRYSDVRLVFAPEGPIAFFGGDPDNFTFPRHDMDISFYRAYDDGRPVQTDFFQWSAEGSAEGDLIFVVGNPGSTGRLNTMAQLTYLRDVQYPATLDAFARQIGVLHELSAMDPERARALRNRLFGIENTQKATRGYLAGLRDSSLMAQKQRWEDDFRARVQRDPNLRPRYAGAWDEIAGIRKELAALDARRRFHTTSAYGSRLMTIAGLLVRMPAEMAKPDADRLPLFRESNRRRLEGMLYGPTPVDTAYERRMLAQFFSAMAATLPEDDPVRRVALGRGSPEDAAAAMVQGTMLLDQQQVRTLASGGASTVESCTDPFVTLARVIVPLEREMEQKVTALFDREAQQDERVARALLAVFGNKVAPDATFSLRISDGVVKRYPYNGTFAPPFTTFHGLYDRWAGFGGKEPWQLPPRWVDARSRLELATPLNGVSTNDIIGGNSGSPVINRAAEIVGLIFDGNIEQLPTRFLYRERVERSVWVDSRGILEALRNVFGAAALADELAPKKP